MAWIQRELDALGIPPLKRFGQHFLLDKVVRDTLIDQAALSASDTVLEVGPGFGFLTRELAKKTGHVIAVEKDRTLADYLKKKFSASSNVTIMQGDILDVEIPEQAKIVSSPPYNISSKLILMILNSRFKLASLLLQEEFVKRLTASSGSSDYGRLSIMFQCNARAKFVMQVPRTAFYPKPRVNSALVNMTPIQEKPRIENSKLFEELVRALFTQRRRKLRGVLARYLKRRYPAKSDLILQRATVLEKRVYEISPEELVNLSNQIADALTELKIEGDRTAN